MPHFNGAVWFTPLDLLERCGICMHQHSTSGIRIRKIRIRSLPYYGQAAWQSRLGRTLARSSHIKLPIVQLPQEGQGRRSNPVGVYLRQMKLFAFPFIPTGPSCRETNSQLQEPLFRSILMWLQSCFYLHQIESSHPHIAFSFRVEY